MNLCPHWVHSVWQDHGARAQRHQRGRPQRGGRRGHGERGAAEREGRCVLSRMRLSPNDLFFLAAKSASGTRRMLGRQLALRGPRGSSRGARARRGVHSRVFRAPCL